MGAPDNCLLKGGPIPRYMKDTGMFDTISVQCHSQVSIDVYSSGKSGLVSERLLKLLLLLFYSWRIRAANKKTVSLIASMRLFYHRYLIIVNCNSVSLGVLSMLVLLLMSGPVLPTHRDPKVKEEGFVPSGAHGQGREG